MESQGDIGLVVKGRGPKRILKYRIWISGYLAAAEKKSYL